MLVLSPKTNNATLTARSTLTRQTQILCYNCCCCCRCRCRHRCLPFHMMHVICRAQLCCVCVCFFYTPLFARFGGCFEYCVENGYTIDQWWKNISLLLFFGLKNRKTSTFDCMKSKCLSWSIVRCRTNTDTHTHVPLCAAFEGKKSEQRNRWFIYPQLAQLFCKCIVCTLCHYIHPSLPLVCAGALFLLPE